METADGADARLGGEDFVKDLAPGRTATVGRALARGTLAVALLDGAFAAARAAGNGRSPLQPFRAVAAGLLGSDAFRGGTPAALLGVALHVTIAACVVATYLAASRRLPALVRHPLLCGTAYGLAVYIVMYHVVIPLSALAAGPRSLAETIPALLIHIGGVGIPAALAARSTRFPVTWPARPPARRTLHDSASALSAASAASVYYVGAYDIDDPVAYEAYAPMVLALLPKYGGELLAADTAAFAVEGRSRTMNAIIRFPSREAALGLYEDPAYQAAKQLRQRSTSNITMVLVNSIAVSAVSAAPAPSAAPSPPAGVHDG